MNSSIVNEMQGVSSPPTSFLQANYPTFHSLLNFCNHFVMPVMIVIGIVGNILTFLVFVFSSLKRLSTSVFLAALAFVDCGFLLSLGTSWIDNFRFSFFQQEVVCTFIIYATYMFSFLSVWSVVCFTTEMYLTMFHGDLAAKISRPNRARMIVCALTFFSGMMYLHTFWTTERVVIANGRQTCTSKSDQDVSIALALTDTFLTLLLPFTLLIFMNVRIFLVIAGFAKTRGEMLPPDSDNVRNEALESTGQDQDRTALTLLASEQEGIHQTPDEADNTDEGNLFNGGSSAAGKTVSFRKSSVVRPRETTGEVGGTGENDKKDTTEQEILSLGELSYDPFSEEYIPPLAPKKPKTMQRKIINMQKKSFKLLLTVATVFLLLSLPSHAIRVQGLFRSLFQDDYVTTELEHLCQQLFQFLYYSNFTVNFIIYNVCAKSFRTAFFSLPLIFSKTCMRKASRKGRDTKISRRVGQELRQKREEQNSRLVEVNLAELHLSKVESFASDFKYQSPPCLLRITETDFGTLAEEQ